MKHPGELGGRVAPGEDGLHHVRGAGFRVPSGRSSCLCRIWRDTGPWLVVARASLSQDGLQLGGFWEVDRTYYGLAAPPSFGPSLD